MGLKAQKELLHQSYQCALVQVHQQDLLPILLPILCTIFLLLIGGMLAYKFRISQMIAQMRIGIEKRSPPGAEKEVTLVLTDIQVGGTVQMYSSEQCYRQCGPRAMVVCTCVLLVL